MSPFYHAILPLDMIHHDMIYMVCMKTRAYEDYASAKAQAKEIKKGLISEMREYYLKGLPSVQLAKYYHINIHTFYVWLNPTPEERGVHAQNLTRFNLPSNPNPDAPKPLSEILEQQPEGVKE